MQFLILASSMGLTSWQSIIHYIWDICLITPTEYLPSSNTSLAGVGGLELIGDSTLYFFESLCPSYLLVYTANLPTPHQSCMYKRFQVTWLVFTMYAKQLLLIW